MKIAILGTGKVAHALGAGLGPATVFVSGDDETAKSEVKGLLHDLGWEDEGIIDLGSIRTARGPENYIMLFFETIGVLKSPLFNIHITR